MIEQIASPEQTVVGTSVSRHVAAFAPIIFQFQRKDWTTTGYSNYGGSVQITIATTDTSLFSLGDSVYFYASDGGSNTVSGVATITLVNVTTDTQIVIDLDYSSFTPVFQYINLLTVYSDYTADFEVHSPRTNLQIDGAAQSVKSTKTGLVEFDVSPYVRNLPLIESFDFSGQQNCPEIAQPFFLMVGETKNGTSGSKSRLDSADYWSIMYYPPIGGSFGSNMGDYVGFPGGSAEESGAFLDDFESPTFFQGWPFSLEFLYSPNGVVDALSMNTVQRDQNSVDLSDTETTIVVDDLEEPIKVAIDETILSPTRKIAVSIGGVTLFSLRTNFDPATDGTFDPSIVTTSGIATWLFENLSIMNGNGISTTGNGLDGTIQSVQIVNLDPAVITSLDAQNDKIYGAFAAASLPNLTLLRLQDNGLTAFYGPKATTAAMAEFNLSNNPGLTDVFMDGYSNLQGTVNLSNCAIVYISFPQGVTNAINLDLSNNSLGYVNLLRAFPNLGGANNITVDVSDNGLSQSQVNSYILDFDRNFPASYTGRNIYIDGTNSAPNLANPSVAAAINSLSVTKSVNVVHN